MTLLTLACIWGGLALAVLVLAMARRWVSRREDDTVHLADSEAPLVQQQASVATVLSRLDRWGKSLTMIVLLYGLALIGRVVYMGWVASSQIK
jgi:hypothetical protein